MTKKKAAPKTVERGIELSVRERQLLRLVLMNAITDHLKWAKEAKLEHQCQTLLQTARACDALLGKLAENTMVPDGKWVFTFAQAGKA